MSFHRKCAFSGSFQHTDAFDSSARPVLAVAYTCIYNYIISYMLWGNPRILFRATIYVYIILVAFASGNTGTKAVIMVVSKPLITVI